MSDGPRAWAFSRFTMPLPAPVIPRADGPSPRWQVSGDCALRPYLLFARVIGHPEEGRYVQLRKEWKNNLALRFLFFFEFQALLDAVLSLPFLLACLDTGAPLGFLEKFAPASGSSA